MLSCFLFGGLETELSIRRDEVVQGVGLSSMCNFHTGPCHQPRCQYH